MRISNHIGLIAFIGFCVFGYDSAKAVKLCKPADCEGEQCPQTPCHHGSCTPTGSCQCVQPCWTGEQCTQFNNRYSPTFRNLKYDFRVGPTSNSNEELFRVEARDEDEYSCSSTSTDCLCGTVIYSIQGADSDSVFNISSSGTVYLNYGAFLREGEEHHIVVTARNPPGPAGESSGPPATQPVTIYVERESVGYVDRQENMYDGSSYGPHKSHHISKRAITPVASEVDFYFYKTGDYENVTTMYPGSKIHFQLRIHFPPGTTDMLVEIFTPDNDTTVMVVCNPQITHVGANLDLVQNSITPVLEGKTADTTEYDRAILELGNITNDNTNTADADVAMVDIEWDVVMIDCNDPSKNGSTLWASVGAQYNDSAEVFVAQASFEVVMIPLDPVDAPTFNMTGPSYVEIGSSVVFRVDMFLPYDVIYLVFDAFAPLNATDVMSICSVVLVDTDVNYECLEKEKFNHVAYPAASGKGNDRNRLTIGNVVNKGSREDVNPVEKNRISIEFVGYLYDDEAFIGNEYWVGAALELGTDQIWAGQLKFQAINRTSVNMTETPVFDFVTMSSTNRSVGSSVKYELTMEVPEGTDGDYELEILAPFNDTARFKLCQVTLTYNGLNVPCVGDKEPVYSSRDNATGITDRAVWKIGRIRNFAHRHTSFDPDANKIKFEIVAQVLNHSLNLLGEMVYLTAGVTFDDDRIWVGQNAVIMTDELDESVNDTSPDFSLSYEFGDDYVPIGGYASVLFEIDTKPGGLYFPMDVELILPFENDTAVYTMCRAEVFYAGKNLPCFNASSINSTIAYTSKEVVENSTRYDKAVFSLGYVCNTDDGSVASEPDDNKIKIRAVFKVEEHESMVADNTKDWFSSGIMFQSTKMWVGQMATFASNITFGQLEYNTTAPSNQVPYQQVIRKDNETTDDVMQGGVAIYNVFLKLPPQSRADWKIIVDVSADPDLHVCAIYIKEYGYGIPCLDKTKEPIRTKRTGTFKDEKIEFELPQLTNVGLDPLVENGEFDNNTIVLEFAVQVDIAATGSKTVGVALQHGTTSINADQTINVVAYTAINETTNATMPTFEFDMVPIHENLTLDGNYELGKGQVAKFKMDITVPEYSTNNLVIKFLTPVNDTGVMEICNINVISVGKNIPCLKKEEIIGTKIERISSEYMDIGSVDLGTVCHIPIDDENDTANVIQIEGIAKVTKVNTKVDGEGVWFSSTARINDDQIYVSQIKITVRESLEYNETEHNTGAVGVSLNMTDDVLYVRPGEVFYVDLDVKTPPNATVATLVDVDLPTNDSAVVTFRDMKVIKSGANLACLCCHDDEYVFVENTTLGNTQMTKAYQDYGKITNTGHTYRHNVREDDEDTFRVRYELQMADAIVSTNGSWFWVSFGAKVGDVLSIIDKKVAVMRTFDEMPDILLEASINQTGVFNLGDCIGIDALIKHTNLSSAEGYNVSASFFFPNYMNYTYVNDSNYTIDPQISSFEDPRGVSFTFDTLYFTDIFKWTFEVCVIAVTGSRAEQPAITPFEAGCNIIYRDYHVNTSGTYFVTRLDSLTYQVLPPTDASSECTPSVLDVEDPNVIGDCQIEGSESADITNNPPSQGRKNAAGWISATRRGNFTRYFQVNFGNITKVTDVTVQNPPVMTNREGLTQFTVFYSDDTINWEQGETVSVAGTTTPNALVSQSLSSPMESRYLKFVFDEDTSGGTDGTSAASFELSGCTISADIPFEDVCNMHRRAWNDPNVNVSGEFMTRSFLHTGADLYFCDANPYKNNEMECFTTTDGLAWSALDNSIVNVLGELNGELFGIAWDQRAFMHSEDAGETWMAISYAQFAKSKADAGFQAAIHVPWIKETAGNPLDVNLVMPHVSYTQNAYGAYYEGIYGGGRKIADWTRCCQ